MPQVAVGVHRLSCVMSHPPPDAKACALGVLREAYEVRDVGITFRRVGLAKERSISSGRMTVDLKAGAPIDTLEMLSDASTADRHTYGCALTYAGAAVMTFMKKIGCAVSNTHEAEQVASTRASEHLVYALLVMRGLGVHFDAPAALLVTDNLANQRVLTNQNASTKSRYFLIRQHCLHERISEGLIRAVYVPDPQNPSRGAWRDVRW